MHRKFIALIVSTAIIVTGLSAVPARAGDNGKLLGGLAALAILGIAASQYEKRKERRRQQATRQTPAPVYSVRPSPPVRPVHPVHPKKRSRYDLPGRCLERKPGYPGRRPVFGERCLQKNFRGVGRLPGECRIRYWNGRSQATAYRPRCLSRWGYRVAY